MNYNAERENNIIKNIAKEVEAECQQNGTPVIPELANYMVKLYLLNPKHGFTASEVMPRSLTQQLVTLVVDELKQDTPQMNCIRLQVYWSTLNLSVPVIQKEYTSNLEEKGEPFLYDAIGEDNDYNVLRTIRHVAFYILVSQDLGNISHQIEVKETIAAFTSLLKPKDIHVFMDLPEEQKPEKLKEIAKRVTGIRLFLKQIGKGGENIQDVRKITDDIDSLKKAINNIAEKVSNKINNLREVINSVLIMDFFTAETCEHANVLLPPECDAEDIKHAGKLLCIMLQHSFYLNDLSSKLDEIENSVNFYLQEYDRTLKALQETIKDREAVPATEVYDNFRKTGELWMEIKSYSYCLETLEEVMNNLEKYNKKEYFEESVLEHYAIISRKTNVSNTQKTSLDHKSALTLSNVAMPENAVEDFHIELNGFCAWTLYFAKGFLVPGDPKAGYYQYEDMYFTFANDGNHDLWSRNPHYYLMNIYEILRDNPEMVELLNAYDNLYAVRSLQLIKRVDRKISSRSEEIQTDVHPIEQHWVRDYTFSIWELKKRALALSRLAKCVTKSVQTTSPHSHFRASIGLLAAPDKSKETQTKRDNSCMHETISNYLYGLRGHREDKFRVLELTRPIEETCERQIILEGDKLFPMQKSCISRREKTTENKPFVDPCFTWSPPDLLTYFTDYY